MDIFKNHLNENNFAEKLLDISISAFLTYCKYNWNTLPDKLDLQQYFGTEWPQDIDVSLRLQRDSEPLFPNTLYPELLYFSLQIFNSLSSLEHNVVIFYNFYFMLWFSNTKRNDTILKLYIFVAKDIDLL